MNDHDDRWWWLSFVDPDGGQFLGVCVVRRHSFVAAIQRAHQLGINPGGQVEGQALPKDKEPPDTLREKLVTDRAALDRIVQQWTGAEVSS